MNILVIGGTQFVGLHMARQALANGHHVTLFNRGETNPDILPEAEKLTGDRDGNLGALEGRTWDRVIDACGYVPRIVKQSVDLLEGAVGQYVFISTISVYNDEGKNALPEDSELLTMEDESVEDIDGETYGPLKVLCEKTVLNAFGDAALIVRPGLIVGPDDYTDRFTYWPRRMKQGGRMLVPDVPDQPVQYIDARDLAAFTIGLTEKKQGGIYNAVGPEEEETLGTFLRRCKDITSSEAEFVPVADEFLRGQEDIKPFNTIPMWLSADKKPYGMMRADNARAIAAGLTLRPLEEIIADTLTWDAARPEKDKYYCGLKPERERELLDLWAREQAKK